MNTIIRVNFKDLNSRFFRELGQKFVGLTNLEIHIPEKKQSKEPFSDEDFWSIINSLDWSKKNAQETLAPAVKKLASMPIVNIYLFADKLSEKLYQLDTQTHGDAYLKTEGCDYLSVDDFLYVRCAVVAEGQYYFEKVRSNPSELSSDISFEPLLSLAGYAYKEKTGKHFDYKPTFNYETYSNKNGWNA